MGGLKINFIQLRLDLSLLLQIGKIIEMAISHIKILEIILRFRVGLDMYEDQFDAEHDHNGNKAEIPIWSIRIIIPEIGIFRSPKTKLIKNLINYRKKKDPNSGLREDALFARK